MRISKRGTVVILVVVIVAAIGLFFILRKPAPPPRLWTADAVFKHLQDNYLTVENITTNYAALPPDLPNTSNITCRVHVIFTIRDILNNAIPNNQLFICNSPQDVSTLFQVYETQVSQFVSIHPYLDGRVVLADFLQGYDRQATQSILI